MDASPTPDLVAFYTQEIGAVLFGLVFLFLYRQSRMVYFGLWALAWAARLIACAFGFQLLRTGEPWWAALYAIFEFAFVIVLISAARGGFASGLRDWRQALRVLAVLPVFVALMYVLGSRFRWEAFYVSDALVVAAVYFYNFLTLHPNRGIGSRVFRFSLLLLAGAFVLNAAVLISGAIPGSQRHVPLGSYYDFVLHCVLVFAATAMWSEGQEDRIRELAAEADHLRRESVQSAELDRLTGLLNQSALARRVEQPEAFQGVVAVCDMDNFKEINDRYGHLVGDEILRNVGSLLRGSIRHEDEAFRWGGDEFVILFHNQNPELATNRMGAIADRLREFRVRGSGVLPISFSWGTADAHDRALRDALDEADQKMYTLKRARASHGR